MIIKSQRAEEVKCIRNHSFPVLDMNDAGVMEQIEYASSDPEQQVSLCLEKIAMLQQQLQTVGKQSFADGFEKGKHAGHEQGLQTIRPNVEILTTMVEAVRQQPEELVKSAEGFIVTFALKVAEKVIGSEVFSQAALDMTLLQKVIGDALNQFSDSTKYILRVHKDIAGLLEQRIGEIRQKLTRPVALAITADASLKPGDCLIECDYGVLDARIDARLKEISRQLK
ncbi:MAG TPA: FliH/SctL family protein [bacterium]